MFSKKILIVDDDIDICITTKYILEQAGYSVFSAGSGEKALERVKLDRPDLLILDLKLPGLPGEEVCREIRRDKETSDLPIIMLTAKDSDVDRIVGKVIGANNYIAKPFAAGDLLKAVSRILEVP